MIDIRQAMTDPALFGDQFASDTFTAWRALLSGFYGLPLDDGGAAIWQEVTGREYVAGVLFRELWLAIGRRGGKSQVAALLAIFEALFRDHRDKLAPGEVATCMVIAADRKQARAVMRYISGLVNENPMLRRMVLRENSEQIEFDNRAAIEVHTASHRSVRGYTLSAAILDECAFWHVDGANPDKEIVSALRPALATLDGKLIALSSPYAKRGILWDAHKRYFASDHPRVLVAQAPSRTMNPTLPQAVVEQALQEDREAALAEYMAQFRGDIATFLDVELIAESTRRKPLELQRVTGLQYFAFVDPAGGGKDEFTMAVAHMDEGRIAVDAVRGRRGSPADCVAEFAQVLAGYGINRVVGDRYAGRWPRDEFAKHGIAYAPSPLDRSGLYLEFLAALNSGRVELPPCEATARQFAALERRTSRSGRDSIDHPPNGSDDRANAVAGVVALASAQARRRRGVLWDDSTPRPARPRPIVQTQVTAT